MNLLKLILGITLLIFTRCTTKNAPERLLKFRIDSVGASEAAFGIDSSSCNEAGIHNIKNHVFRFKEVCLTTQSSNITNAKLVLVGLDFPDSIGIFYNKNDSLMIATYKVINQQLVCTTEESSFVLDNSSQTGDTVVFHGRKLFKQLTFIIDTVKLSSDSVKTYSLSLIPLQSTSPGIHRPGVRSLVIDQKGEIHSIGFAHGGMELQHIGLKRLK